MTLKKHIAREWLTLLIGIVIGIVVMPAVISCILWIVARVSHDTRSLNLGEVYKELLLSLIWEVPFGPEPVVAWSIVLIPYGLYQLIRSIVWAVKTVRTKE